MEKTSTHSLLNKMLLRSFKKAWAQFLAVIAIGAIAVTLFVGLLANAQSFENRVNEVYSEGNLASLWVTTTRYEKEDQEMISSFLEEGEEMDGRLYLPCEANAKSVYLSFLLSHKYQNPMVRWNFQTCLRTRISFILIKSLKAKPII